jgi:hypothetical protein
LYEKPPVTTEVDMKPTASSAHKPAVTRHETDRAVGAQTGAEHKPAMVADMKPTKPAMVSNMKPTAPSEHKPAMVARYETDRANMIGDAGVKSLTEACASGALSKLKILDRRHSRSASTSSVTLASVPDVTPQVGHITDR